MRSRWLLLGFPALILAGCSSQRDIEPDGIVSNNPCIDGVLEQIAAPGQIAAVSIYSHDAASASASLAWGRHLPAIGTSAEEVITAQPRLLLTGSLASSGTNAALAKAGVKLLGFGVPASVAENKQQIRAIAKAIGREAAGEQLVRRIDRAITPLPQAGGAGGGPVTQTTSETAPTPNPSRKREGDFESAIIWQSGGFVPGKGTLQDELLARAGFVNASAAYGLKQWQQLPFETLIRKPPSVIFMPVRGEGDAGRELAMRKRLLRHLRGKSRIVSFPDRLLFCGGPTIIEAMKVMRKS